MKLLFVGDVPGAMEAWGDIDRAAAESPHQAAARRARSALLHIGVEATVAATQLQNGERLRDFYRRMDAILKGRKANRVDLTPPPTSGFCAAA